MKKWQAMIMAADRVAESNEQLGREIRQSNKELADRMSEISHAEIKARDRVDMSLDAYEKIIRSIEHTKNENMMLWNIFNKLHLPSDIIFEILPDTISMERCHNPSLLKTRYRIEFDVDDIPSKGE